MPHGLLLVPLRTVAAEGGAAQAAPTTTYQSDGPTRSLALGCVHVSCVLGGVRKRMGVRAGLTLDLELKNTTEVVKLLTRSCQEQTIRLHTEAVTGCRAHR